MKVWSATRLLPQHQRLEVRQALDRTGNMLVKAAERGLWLLLLLDSGQFFMERKMLLGIKQRAERSWAPSC